MENDFGLSVRTMDLGPLPGLEWGLINVPAGRELAHKSMVAKHGFVAFVPYEADVPLENTVTAGMNTVRASTARHVVLLPRPLVFC
jgi:hypothetical protein